LPGGRQAALAAVGSWLVAVAALAATAAVGGATAGLGGGGGSFDAAGLPAFWWPVSRLATASA
jgi:hypothetical protein